MNTFQNLDAILAGRKSVRRKPKAVKGARQSMRNNNATISYYYCTSDHYGWGVSEGEISAKKILQSENLDWDVEKSEDGKFAICPICGAYYTQGDWGAPVCPHCAKELLGDSHDWNEAMWELWNGDLYEMIVDNSVPIQDIIEEAASMTGYKISANYVKNSRKIENMKPQYVSIIDVAKKALREV